MSNELAIVLLGLAVLGVFGAIFFIVGYGIGFDEGERARRNADGIAWQESYERLRARKP